MNDIKTWNFENSKIRTFEDAGEPWWILADVCKVLELSDTGRTAQRLDADELTRVKLVSGGQTREKLIVRMLKIAT